MGKIVTVIFSRRRQGFGIMEVLVAIVVLGFLLVGLMHLQSGNRDSLLRIRARDGANTVAQETIDSLAALGLASVPATSGAPLTFVKERTWEGRPGLLTHTMRVQYNVSVDVSDDSLYRSGENSAYDSLKHVYAKKLQVSVSWRFKSSTQSISMSGVIR